MEHIDLNNYIGKETGDILEAVDWNSLHTVIQNKVNDIVDASNQADSDIDTIVEKLDGMEGVIELEDNDLQYTKLIAGEASVGHRGSNNISKITPTKISTGVTSLHSESTSSMTSNTIEVTRGDSYSGTSKVTITPTQVALVELGMAGEQMASLTISATDGISINGNTGVSDSYIVTTDAGQKVFTFTNGILTAVNNYTLPGEDRPDVDW